jgi:hypothetical protein
VLLVGGKEEDFASKADPPPSRLGREIEIEREGRGRGGGGEKDNRSSQYGDKIRSQD